MSELKIVYKQTDELIPYVNNPRINDNAVDVVANSIKQFGFKNPIIIDKNDIVVAGHTRLKAALKLGLGKVPTIMVDDLTDDQIKAFRLADNKVAEAAEWDFDKLEIELDGLQNLGFDFDMADFGFPESNDFSFDINDEDFLSDENLPEKKPKTTTCPYCGKEFEI